MSLTVDQEQRIDEHTWRYHLQFDEPPDGRIDFHVRIRIASTASEKERREAAFVEAKRLASMFADWSEA
jgi:hypothetical protein